MSDESCDLTSVSVGVKSVLPEESLKHSGWYRNEPIRPSTCSSGRIAPVVHHRRPHNNFGVDRLVHATSLLQLKIEAAEIPKRP